MTRGYRRPENVNAQVCNSFLRALFVKFFLENGSDWSAFDTQSESKEATECRSVGVLLNQKSTVVFGALCTERANIQPANLGIDGISQQSERPEQNSQTWRNSFRPFCFAVVCTGIEPVLPE